MRRVKRDGGCDAATGAVDFDFDFAFDAVILRSGDALGFGLLAGFTAFRRIAQTFVAENQLFARCPDELRIRHRRLSDQSNRRRVILMLDAR